MSLSQVVFFFCQAFSTVSFLEQDCRDIFGNFGAILFKLVAKMPSLLLNISTIVLVFFCFIQNSLTNLVSGQKIKKILYPNQG